MKFKAQRILALLLAVFVAVPALAAHAAEQAPEGVVTSSGSGVSHYDYFSDVYPSLKNESHVFATTTYEDIAQIFKTPGTYAVVFGGAANSSTQAQIAYINQVAKEKGIEKVYNFDTRLDGKDDLDIANSENPFAYKYTDLIHAYLTNAPDAADVQNQTYVFVYNKDNGGGPVVAGFKSAAVAADFQTGGNADASKIDAYKAQIRSVFGQANAYSTISAYDLIAPGFNHNGPFYAPTAPPIFDESDKDLVLEHVTYDELIGILRSEGDYVLLFGGSWCPNTQAAVKYVNEYAKKYGVDKVYFFDPRIDAGLDVTKPDANYHDNDKLMIRDSKNAYAYLYVDLAKQYLTNLRAEYETRATSNISYTDGNGAKVEAIRLQVPYFFTYNKDNKDADGNAAPILGHIELMYGWGDTSKKDADATKSYANYIEALNSVLSRTESLPSGLVGAPPSQLGGTDGRIDGVGQKALEYKKASDTEYTAVGGSSILGLAPGEYDVRYKSIFGAQKKNSTTKSYDKIVYKPGQSVRITVPARAPQGLKGIATTVANDVYGGQIAGTAAGQEYKKVGADAYLTATTPSITGLVYGDYLVRYKAINGTSASLDTLVTVPKFGQQSAPAGLEGVAPSGPDLKDGQITGITEGLEYKDASVANAVYTKIAGNGTNGALTGLEPGTYTLRYAASDKLAVGPSVDVVVPSKQAQAVPTGLQGEAPTSSANNDGRITGVNADLEYKAHGAAAYTPVTGSTIAGLAAGKYHVRVAAKPGFYASADVEVTVPEYAAPYVPPVGTPATPTPTPTAPPAGSGAEDGKTVVSVKLAAKHDTSNGLTSAAVTASEVSGLVDSAKKAEAEGKKVVIELNIEANADTKSGLLTLPRDAVKALAGATQAEVKINYAGFGAITFDAKAFASIGAAEGTGDISIQITKSELTEEGKQVLGDRPVYDLAVIAGDANVSVFGGGKVNVSLPYTLKSGESANAIVVYYVNETTGELETVRGKFDASAKEVKFTTTHFSQYIVGYNPVSFADVAASSWYGDAVGFLAARGITTGTDAGHYSPGATVSRGQFVTLLLKAYGIAPETGAADNFADAGDAYYTGYLAAAKRLGIATGAGGNFAPDSQISRQELFTLLYRTLNVLGELPTAKTGATVSGFSDAGAIAAYAQDAFKALVESGVVSGNGGKLSPAGVSTRAEVAQVLFNLLSK
ncbi:S-layer homology domain-containing protein [Cohnella sp. OV330]|uniref:S-layer homology domain-containing protein n=1 Tax=Cohnella sp. OV330 TaxID=1855288 RepID=UPI0008F316E0|nr:S-layer homology domain-containing protein [Cohnella sp. OV330]SFB47605.1 S-layer homology domain-containing protein [Cohnella sp. OV330]